MIHTICVCLLCFFLPQQVAEPQADSQLQEAVRKGLAKALPASVVVRSKGGGHFSAVIVSAEGDVLTAAHCISSKRSEYTVHLTDGRKFKAESRGLNRQLDCGRMKILEPKDLPFAELGDSDALQPGQTCISIGNPTAFNLKRGQVARFGRYVGKMNGFLNGSCIMGPGDSGGGLFDLDGRLIGIHSQIRTSLATNMDVPVNVFKKYNEQLAAQGSFKTEAQQQRRKTVTRPQPQPRQPFTERHLPGLKLNFDKKNANRAEVVELEPDSVAAAAGVQVGDWISQVNAKATANIFRVRRRLKELKPGDEFDVVFSRQETEATISTSFTIPGQKQEPKKADTQQKPKPAAVAETKPQRPVFNFRPTPDQITALSNLTVRVSSKRGEKDVATLGIRYTEPGVIVSKSSRVRDQVQVTVGQSQPVPAKVIGRDEDTDLVFLQIDSDTLGSFASAAYPERGEFLISNAASGPETTLCATDRFDAEFLESPIWLGVGVKAVADGLQVTSIRPGGPASRARLRKGNVIKSVGGVETTTPSELRDALNKHQEGDEVRVLFSAEGSEYVRTLKLELRPTRRRTGHVADGFPGGPSSRRDGFDQVGVHVGDIHPQHCGGPVLDAQSRFVGINIARYSRTQTYVLDAQQIAAAYSRATKPPEPAADASIAESTPPNMPVEPEREWTLPEFRQYAIEMFPKLSNAKIDLIVQQVNADGNDVISSAEYKTRAPVFRAVVAGPEPWMKDFAAAKDLSARTGKSMLIMFEADWCGPCKVFDKNVATAASVQEALREFIPTRVDIDLHAELAREFEITAIPAFLILDPQGDVTRSTKGSSTAKAFTEWLAGTDKEPNDND